MLYLVRNIIFTALTVAHAAALLLKVLIVLLLLLILILLLLVILTAEALVNEVDENSLGDVAQFCQGFQVFYLALKSKIHHVEHLSYKQSCKLNFIRVLLEILNSLESEDFGGNLIDSGQMLLSYLLVLLHVF
jgi:hypothetical protein